MRSDIALPWPREIDDSEVFAQGSGRNSSVTSIDSTPCSKWNSSPQKVRATRLFLPQSEVDKLRQPFVPYRDPES